MLLKDKLYVGNVKCDICNHTWFASHYGNSKIQCPNCKLMVSYTQLTLNIITYEN